MMCMMFTVHWMNLNAFTNAVERWDLREMEHLPAYMKICFLALFNSINEMGYDTLKEQGVHIIPYLQKMDEMERGDIPKSIQCYMHETGASEEDARKHMKYLIGEAWKKMNKARVEDGPLFSRAFIGVAENLARMAQCMYQYGDGHGCSRTKTQGSKLQMLRLCWTLQTHWCPLLKDTVKTE
ncbi:terpenoid cyclases/Protein prenyltransferases superfamily protein [Actinidia rufa]|uniref:Terpenoid cyclases/Protein prenyltransferases superfamily protein n=1 Tax=Actinidia rufa TaxID=165716 RepID=A0A7J0DMY2_9ERIC|nr:terpenoid cyclases/Protein prenyltransferases superfamily protein [Actinidia rufa]